MKYAIILLMFLAGEAMTSEGEVFCFLWHNGDGSCGWLVLKSDYALMTCCVVVPGSGTVRFRPERDRTQDSILVDVTLAPISVRVAGTNTGYAVRIARNNIVIPLNDVPVKMFFSTKSNAFFATFRTSDEKVLSKLEESEVDIPPPDLIKKWKENGCISIDAILDVDSGQEMSPSPATHVLP